jgi:hypothetical protein
VWILRQRQQDTDFNTFVYALLLRPVIELAVVELADIPSFGENFPFGEPQVTSRILQKPLVMRRLSACQIISILSKICY